ncbi:MAG: hypothetical protein KDK97_07720 [Verrucomicrobiales bacterium]|nr:hypothetical protein [Verrucomicrobiales bacterium]MCP5560683.1 hypothetical protein [Verrucomicrobiaceae bacterium]
MNLRDLHVRKGDPVLPAWNKLLEWAGRFRLFAGRGVRLTRTPNGTFIVAETKGIPWDHPFKVTVSTTEATVLPGTLNNQMPTISGRLLDEDPVPLLKLVGGPNRELRSWVCLDVRVDAKTGAIDQADKGAVAITHAREPDSREVGRHPLAMLIWNADRTTVRRVHQITHFNLQHRFTKAVAGKPSRHLFWPA